MNKLLNYFLLNLLLSTILFASSEDLNKVSLQLQWKHQFEFAGFYMAKEKGFYKDVGFDVTLKEFHNKINIVEDVNNQTTTYGMSNARVILEKANNTDIVLLSSILQESANILISLKSSGIKNIKDFKNKKIMGDKNSLNSASYISMLKSNNIIVSDLVQVEHSFNLDDLINKKIDILSCYSTNELYFLDKKGIKYDIWDPKDYGFNFYDSILFTSSKELKEHPKQVENFRTASLKGWEYAFENIEETVQVILDKYNTQNKTRESLIYEAKALKKLALTKKLGLIEKDKVQRIWDIYNVLGLTTNTIDLDEFIYNPNKNKNELTEKEKAYLKEKQVIKMCIDPNWMPFEAFNENALHVGMSADYSKLFQEYIGIEIQAVQTKTWNDSLKYIEDRKCDVLALVMKTKQREKYLNFSAPYLVTTIVLATKSDVAFINNLKELKNKKIAIVKGYALEKIIKEKYKNFNIVAVENVEDGLSKVANGTVFGFVDSIATISYVIQTEFTHTLKISGKFDEKWQLGLGVRNDDKILLSIFEKAIKYIDTKTKQKILNDWISIKYESKVDYDLVIAIVLISLLLILLFLYRQYVLKNINKKLEQTVKKKTMDLEDLNKYLKQTVKDRTKELQNQKETFEIIYNGSRDAIAILDTDTNFLDVNPAYCKLTSMSKSDLLKTSCVALTSPKDIERSKMAIQEVLELGFVENFEKECGMKNGKYITVNMSMSLLKNPTRVLASVRDITKLKEQEKALELLAATDPMTKLYNRRYFSKTSESLLDLAKRNKTDIAIIMIDIDYFKNVNDTYGHKIGDDVIKTLSNLLQKLSRKSDIVARWGGEEFVILLPETNIDGALVISEKIRQEVQKIKISISTTKEVNFTVSIGVSKIYLEDINIEPSINRADIALYEAKQSGRNKVCIKN